MILMHNMIYLGNLMELKIIFPGEMRVKKNNMTKHEIYKDKKTGAYKIYKSSDGRITPVAYYTKAYQEWARTAIEACIVFKSKHLEFTYPLMDKYNLKCLFYSNENKVVDQSALYEGVQDVLTGKSGVFKNIPGGLYQIIYDDNVRFIGSHDGSRYIYSPSEEPHTEVIITEFKW